MTDLTNMTLPELAKHYNDLVEEALKRGITQFELVKRFSDKPSAMKRIARIRVMVGPAPVNPLAGVDLDSEVQAANERANKVAVGKPTGVVHPGGKVVPVGTKTMRSGTKQARVLELAATTAMTVQVMAAEVGTSEREIRHHLHNLKTKFGVSHVVHGDGTLQAVMSSGAKWTDYVKAETGE